MNLNERLLNYFLSTSCFAPAAAPHLLKRHRAPETKSTDPESGVVLSPSRVLDGEPEGEPADTDTAPGLSSIVQVMWPVTRRARCGPTILERSPGRGTLAGPGQHRASVTGSHAANGAGAAVGGATEALAHLEAEQIDQDLNRTYKFTIQKL